MTTETTAPASDAPAPVAVEAPVPAPAPALPNLLGSAPQGDQSSGGDSTGGQSVEGGADSVSGGSDSTAGETSPGDSTVAGDSTEPGSDTLTLSSYDSLALPEGMVANDSLMGEFKAFAFENALAPAAAQRLLDMQATAAASQSAAQLEAFTTTQNEWIAEYRSWPEFTGTKATEASTASLGKLFEEFGSPEVREVMAITGAGNNPHLIRMMLNISKALEEGGPTAPGRPTNSKHPRTPGQILYPNQPTN